MSRRFYYLAGLILTITGLIGIISALGLLFLRYLVLALGLVLLYVAVVKSRRKESGKRSEGTSSEKPV